MRGSIALLFAMCVIYLMSTLGLGLFVSTISRTQQQAMMTTIFFFLMPMIYLSGFIFPIENMPAWIQPFTYLIPLRYFLVIVRRLLPCSPGARRSSPWPPCDHLNGSDDLPSKTPELRGCRLLHRQDSAPTHRRRRTRES